MTQEEKAQRYDKAIEIAKNWHIDAQIDFKKSLETLFPELKCSNEKIRKEIIECVKNYGPSSANPQLFKNMLTWLEKQGEQNHVEWSEEDIEMLNSTISFVEHSAFTTIGKGKNNVIAWLKSLKYRVQPQNIWKPSDVQMQYLSWIANIKLGDSVVEQEVSKHLNELLEDLKKLREK